MFQLWQILTIVSDQVRYQPSDPKDAASYLHLKETGETMEYDEDDYVDYEPPSEECSNLICGACWACYYCEAEMEKILKEEKLNP